ncbi:MAG: hypothetical protein CMJ83_20395 [Planctomycetes bacterium]|nr:hypothetical protein [Planctomycetota bacterium]
MRDTLEVLVIAAGVGQLILCGASLAIPRVLGWRRQVKGLRPLTRQVFWTYAAYIWGTHLAFGLLSTFGADLLVAGSRLAGCVTGFITVYWLARIGIQFFYFDTTGLPTGAGIRFAEAGLVLLFILLTLVYGFATVTNLAGP